MGEDRLGLLQLNDRRKGRFTAEGIALWERLAGYLAVALAKTRAEEALRQSEQQFRTLADSIPNLAWWANADGYITWYNRRWYEYTGTTPEEMEGWGWQSVHDPASFLAFSSAGRPRSPAASHSKWSSPCAAATGSSAGSSRAFCR